MNVCRTTEGRGKRVLKVSVTVLQFLSSLRWGFLECILSPLMDDIDR